MELSLMMVGVYKKTINYESLMGIGEGNPIEAALFQPFSLCSLKWVDVEGRWKYQIDWCVSVCADVAYFVSFSRYCTFVAIDCLAASLQCLCLM